MQEIVETKDADGARWQSEPYDRRLLVMHTDEPYLERERVAQFLQGQRFRTAFFSDVVLGLPYDPFTQSHPTFRLDLDRAAPEPNRELE